MDMPTRNSYRSRAAAPALMLAWAGLSWGCMEEPASWDAAAGDELDVLAPEEDTAAELQPEPAAAAAEPVQGPVEAETVGVAFGYSVQVYEKPSIKSKMVGSLRKGSTLPVKPTGQSDTDCPTGWLWLPKGGGYVCKAHGVKVKIPGDDSVKPPIHAPWYDALLPYDYGRIGNDDLPAYNRFPTGEEARQVKAWLVERRAVLTAQMEAVKNAMEEGTVLPNPYEPIELEVDDGNGQTSTVTTQSSWTADVEEGPVPTEIPFKFVEKILLHGFYVSIGYRTYQGGAPWIKTVRGHLVPASSIHIKDPPATHGIELNEGEDLPVVFVRKSSVTAFTHDAETGKFKASGDKKLERFDAAPVLEKFELGGTEYLKIDDEHYVRRTDILLVEKTPPPKIVKGGQKWIDIDVSQQVLVAYEGEKAVYAALVSTGKERQNIEFKTPRGMFSILSKHVTGTMANLYASDGPYMIEDVPWTMYFIGSYALHGAFWHNGFGGMRSHGCINLPPFDARWLFFWSDPYLPEGWHSIYAGPERPTTVVKVHD